jgi:hypothetical protein
MSLKKVAITEIFLMCLAMISFSYLIGATLPQVSATSLIQTGCCVQDTDGGNCINMPGISDTLCADTLLPTTCDQVPECNPGCCYDSSGGSCTLNAPRSTCLANGGDWSNDATCNEPQCQLGCCVIGSQAIPSTTRQCTVLSAEYGFQKDFQQMDASGICEDYAFSNKLGACVSDSGDYSGEKSCVFTEGGNCNDEFHEGKLCTDPELNTVCVKTRETTCVAGKEQVYYLDSCGNRANIYDSSRYGDELYWTDIFEPSGSCSGGASTCGNCDYSTGSICEEKTVTGVQPVDGDYICNDLNCDNGKLHGDSWCVYDYDVNSIAPVGSRSFIATCLEGEIKMGGCADFNQEICIQVNDSTRTQGRCYPNDWRSCLNANGLNTYTKIKNACNQLPQCIMFNDYVGDQAVMRYDGVNFSGFKENVENEVQGAAGDVGKGSNKIIPFCIPRYTPGFQFWNSQTVPTANPTTSSMGNGGSALETNAICSLASFTCVSKMERECTLTSCESWEDKENWECNIDGKHTNVDNADLKRLMAAMNERCRALGSCGTNIGINGQFGFDEGFSLSRVKIDKKGDQKDNQDVSGYNLSQTYLDQINYTSGLIRLGAMTSVPLGVGIAGNSGGTISGNVQGGIITVDQVVGQADYSLDGTVGEYIDLGAMLGGIGIWQLAAGTIGYAASWVAVGAMLGYQLGNLISKNKGWSPQKATQFNNVMAGLGATAGAAIGATSLGSVTTTSVLLSNGAVVVLEAGATIPAGASIVSASTSVSWVPVAGWVIAIAAAIYAIFTAFFDDFAETEYYILQFNCEGWEPALGGDCNTCNTDVRTCSENRCRSIGGNCRYYTALGEPGTCASVAGTWQAIITPWEEPLSEGSSYKNILQGGFEISGSEAAGEVKSWETLTFGIATDKESACKIDITHTDDYTSMTYDMQAFNNTHHFTILSQFGEQGTIPMQEGENNLYIRCMNFAGQINEAEFAVQFELSDEPDLTPPVIRRTDPVNNGYLRYLANSTDLTIFVSEPSECRINQDYDASFPEMQQNMACVTNPSLGVLGEWACHTQLTNLVSNQNTFYIKCLDKPGNPGTTAQRMLSPTFVYQIDKCATGLDITSITPQDGIIRSSTQTEITLRAQTSGCINGGDSHCSYNFGGGNIAFANTNSSIHEQVFNTLGNGTYNIGLNCIDSAGNEATGSTNLTVIVDQTPPRIVRVYADEGTLKIRTDEPARCALTEEEPTEECNLTIPNSQPLSDLNVFNVNPRSTYWIQCEDEFTNKDFFCQEVRIFN